MGFRLVGFPVAIRHAYPHGDSFHAHTPNMGFWSAIGLGFRSRTQQLPDPPPVDGSLDSKVKIIEWDIKEVLHRRGVECGTWAYGAFEIHPKHLVFVISVDSDLTRDRLKRDAELADELTGLLAKRDWPEEGRAGVCFLFESHETVNRESGGNWFYHFK